MPYGYPDPPNEPQANVSQREYDSFKAENAELRAEVTAQQTEIQRLQAENARLRKALERIDSLEIDEDDFIGAANAMQGIALIALNPEKDAE